MCNLSMDSLKTTYQFDIDPEDIEEDRQKTKEYVVNNLISKVMQYGEAAMLIHNNQLSLVMSEMIFKHSSSEKEYSTPGGLLFVKNVNGEKLRTGFETATGDPCECN